MPFNHPALWKSESRKRGSGGRGECWRLLRSWVVLLLVLQFLSHTGGAVTSSIEDASAVSQLQHQESKSSTSTRAGRSSSSRVRRRSGTNIGGGSGSGSLSQSSLLPPANLSATKGLMGTIEHTSKPAGVNAIDQMQDDVGDSDVNKASDRARTGSLSYLYHQRVYGISLGSTILSFSVLGLVAFVVYAKHRSAIVYRATEDYEAAYDRMLAVLEAYPQYRPIFEHRQLTVFLLDGQFYDSAEKAAKLVLTADRIHQICDECESRANTNQ